MKASRYGIEMTGRSKDPLLGLSSGYHQAAWNLLLPDGKTRPRPEDMPLYRASRYGEEVKGIELVMVTSGGCKLPVVVSAVPIKDKDENIVGASTPGKMFPYRKGAKLPSKNTLKSSSVRTPSCSSSLTWASHDLQEPLRMVTAYLGLLEMKYADQLDGDAKKYMDFAIEGGLRAKHLIQDLLEFSRVDSQAKPLEPTDMQKVLEKVLTNLKMQIDDEHATIANRPLPMVPADDTQMVSVLQNLVSNAIKFHGENAPEIHIACQDKGNEYSFSVQDNGIGIDPQYKDKVFVLFQRLHTRDSYEGTGIGLAIAKKIIERHGGRIWFESEVGKGTTFFFTIPKVGN